MKKSFFLCTWLLLCAFFLPLTVRGANVTVGYNSNDAAAKNITLNGGSWYTRNSKQVYHVSNGGTLTVSASGYSTLYVFACSDNNSATATLVYNGETKTAPNRKSAIDVFSETEAFDTNTSGICYYTINDPLSVSTITVSNKGAYFWFLGVEGAVTPRLLN